MLAGQLTQPGCPLLREVSPCDCKALSQPGSPAAGVRMWAATAPGGSRARSKGPVLLVLSSSVRAGGSFREKRPSGPADACLYMRGLCKGLRPWQLTGLSNKAGVAAWSPTGSADGLRVLPRETGSRRQGGSLPLCAGWELSTRPQSLRSRVSGTMCPQHGLS